MIGAHHKDLTIGGGATVKINLDDNASEYRFMRDWPGQTVNIAVSDGDDITVEMTLSDGAAITGDTAIWHETTLTNGIVTIARPFTGLRFVSAATGGTARILSQ